MNRIAFILLLSALISTGCNKNKETVITGLLIGEADLKTLVYTVPLSGTSFGGFKDTLHPDETGNFELKLTINQPSFIQIETPDPYIAAQILIEPGNSYHITVDISQKDIQISGANEKGQMLYASLPNPSFIEMEASKLNLLADTSLALIQAKVEELKQSDLSRFKELLDKREISKSFFDLIKIDRDCYYASLEARVSIIKIHKMIETKQFVLSNGENVLENLTKIYAQYPPNSEQLMFSSFWVQYAQCYITDYNVLVHEDFDILKIRELYANGRIHAFYINE
jgi:hypothetical protein